MDVNLCLSKIIHRAKFVHLEEFVRSDGMLSSDEFVQVDLDVLRQVKIYYTAKNNIFINLVIK